MSESANAMILRVSPPEFMMTAAKTKNGTAVRTKFSDPTTVRCANPTSERSLKTKKSIVDAINAKAIGTPSRIRTARTPKEISSTVYFPGRAPVLNSATSARIRTSTRCAINRAPTGRAAKDHALEMGIEANWLPACVMQS